MNSFILKRPPYSFNSWKKATASQKLRYKTLLENAFAQFNAENKHETDLYGIVYHFYTKNENIDADNLSKPVWDCLTGFLFEDDSQVKMRIAGSFDFRNNKIGLLDFSTLREDIAAELLQAFEQEEHFIYVECGKLNYNMFTFNLEQYEN